MHYRAAPDRYRNTPYVRNANSGLKPFTISPNLWNSLETNHPLDTQHAIHAAPLTASEIAAIEPLAVHGTGRR